jgi:hypothetical protein
VSLGTELAGRRSLVFLYDLTDDKRNRIRPSELAGDQARKVLARRQTLERRRGRQALDELPRQIVNDGPDPVLAQARATSARAMRRNAGVRRRG